MQASGLDPMPAFLPSLIASRAIDTTAWEQDKQKGRKHRCGALRPV